jgi:hypothetical protein
MTVHPGILCVVGKTDIIYGCGVLTQTNIFRNKISDGKNSKTAG